MLSEILDVPVTLETGTPHDSIDFYNPDNSLYYTAADIVNPLILGNEIGDCRLRNSIPNENKEDSRNNNNNNHEINVDGEQEDSNKYEPCAHFTQEIWQESVAEYHELIKNGRMEAPLASLGALAWQGWYIPKFTAQRDPTLTTYLGLMGEENRRNLAERFLTPITWGDYCRIRQEQLQQVFAPSPLQNQTTTFGDTNFGSEYCASDPTGVAARAPQTKEEEESYHVPGLYAGHFRKTEKNDCDLFPITCVGHFTE